MPAARLPSGRISLLLAAVFMLGIFMWEERHGEGGKSFGKQIQRVWNRDELESNEDHAWRDQNHHTLKTLTICIATQTCRPNQDKLLILQDDHYRKAMIGVPAGERIFARSLMKTFQQPGYTYFFARDLGEVSAFYTLFPDQIVATIIHRNEYDKCYDEWERSCLRSKVNPRGIPITDIFTSQFFGRKMASPFAPWTLVPEDIRDQNNTCIGYYVEEECVKQPFVPTPSRPRQVWLLGKVSKFFHSPHYPFSRDVWVKASKELNVEFIGAFDWRRNLPWSEEPADEGWAAGEKGGVRYGDREVVGHHWDRRPYHQSHPLALLTSLQYGLCYGTPFLNPVKLRLDSDGIAQIVRSQHPFAGNVGEPHVFNVGSSDTFKHPESVDPEADDLLIESLRRAIDFGPRERFIPETMKQEAMNARVRKWLETDWKSEMTVHLESETKWGSDARWKQLMV